MRNDDERRLRCDKELDYDYGDYSESLAADGEEVLIVCCGNISRP